MVLELGLSGPNDHSKLISVGSGEPRYSAGGRPAGCFSFPCEMSPKGFKDTIATNIDSCSPKAGLFVAAPVSVQFIGQVDYDAGIIGFTPAFSKKTPVFHTRTANIPPGLK